MVYSIKQLFLYDTMTFKDMKPKGVLCWTNALLYLQKMLCPDKTWTPPMEMWVKSVPIENK